MNDDEYLKTILENQKDHDERIRSLEKNEAVMYKTVKDLCADMHELVRKVDKLIEKIGVNENEDADKWKRFTWKVFELILAVVVSYLAITVGLK